MNEDINQQKNIVSELSTQNDALRTQNGLLIEQNKELKRIADSLEAISKK